MLSAGVNITDTIEVDTESLVKRVFDLAMENVEFSIILDDRNIYFIMSALEAISKVELSTVISNNDGNVVSKQTSYITEGLYHYTTPNLIMYIYIDENLRGYISNVENI